MSSAAEILELWFSERARARWFASDAAFDDELRARFGAVLAAAANGELAAWTETGDGALALVIVLDQLPRNLFRGTPDAFAYDAEARRVASEAIERQLDRAVALDRRMFFYLPFEHSEALADQERSLALLAGWADEHPPAQRAGAAYYVGYAHQHHDAIRRFGRFPYRNAVLGRASTPDEQAFLDEIGRAGTRPG